MNKIIEDLIADKKSHDEKYKKLSDDLKIISTRIKAITLSDYKDLPYEELKAIKSSLSIYFEKEQKAQFDKIYEEKRNAVNPQLLQANYYPELRDADFLSDNKKIEVDKMLSIYRLGNYVYESPFAYKTKITKETFHKLCDFLYEKGVFKKVYHLLCECGEGGEWLEEERYNALVDGIKNSTTATEWNEDAYVFVGCFECEGFEIHDQKSLDKCRIKVEYKLNKLPNREHESL